MNALRKACLLLAMVAAGDTALAQQPSPTPAQAVEVHLSNFGFTPETIRLQHGVPYTLVIINDTGGGHDFTAGQFFTTAAVEPQDRAKLSGSGVSLSGKESVTLHLTAPVPGTYKVKCTHFMHSAMGMKGSIVVM